MSEKSEVKFMSLPDTNNPYNWDSYFDCSKAAFNFMKAKNISVTVNNFNYWTIVLRYYALKKKILNVEITLNVGDVTQFHQRFNNDQKKKFRNAESLDFFRNFYQVPVRSN